MGDWRLREARDDISRSEMHPSVATGRGWDASHANLLEDAGDGLEGASVYRHSSTTQQLEPSSTSRGATYTWEETVHADLIARYGCRSRDLERGHAVTAPAFYSSKQSRKRSRHEEVDYDRELIRHRKLSGIDSPPASSIIHLQARNSASHSQARKNAIHSHTRKRSRGEDAECEREKLIRHRKLSGIDSPLSINAIQSKAVLRRKEGNGASCRTLQAVEGPHTVITSQKVQHAEGKTLVKQGQDITASSLLRVGNRDYINQRCYRNALSPTSFRGSPPCSPRRATARSNGRLSVNPFQRLGSSRQSLAKRDSCLLAKSKGSELPLKGTGQVTDAIETYSVPVLSSESGMQMSVRKESEVQTHSVDCKAAGRRHGGLECIKHKEIGNPQRRDSKPAHGSTKSSLRGEALDRVLLERLSKGSHDGVNSDVRRKTREVVKDHRQAGEMTISVQRHGQRSLKLEEYRSRDSDFLSFSKISKEQKFSQSPFTASGRRKTSEGRRISATLDTFSKLESIKVGVTYLQRQQISTSKDHVSPYTKHVENEVITLTERSDIGPHRHNSIFSRLTGFKPQTSTAPETVLTSPRTDVVTCQRENHLSLAKDNIPCANKFSPSNNVHQERVDFQVFPVPTRDIETVDTGCLERVSSRQLGQPRARLNKDIMRVQPADSLGGEELPFQETILEINFDPVVDRFPISTSKVCFPSENRAKVVQKETRVLDCAILKKPDQLEARIGSEILNGLLGHSSSHGDSDIGCAEIHAQLLGSGFKSLPKVISTGHKKEQVLRKSSPDQPVVESCLRLTATDVVPVSKCRLKNFVDNFDRIVIQSAEWRPVISACMQQSSPRNRLGCYPSLSKDENASPQLILVDKQLTIGRSTEASALLSQSVQNSREPKEIIPLEVSNRESGCQRSEVGDSPLVICDINVNREAISGLSTAGMTSSNVSVPKEVRLFGANLNASLCEQIDAMPKAGELVNEDEILIAGLTLPGIGDAQTIVSLDSTSAIENLDKHDEVVDLKEQESSQETPLICDDVVEVSKAPPPDAPLTKLQSEGLLSMAKEQDIPPRSLQKVTTTLQGYQLVSSHSAGPHTWRRGTSSSTLVSSARIFRSTGVSQFAGRAGGIQGAAYVRKGNSLVRTFISVSTVQPPTDVKTMTGSMSQPVGPIVRQLPLMTSAPFRNTSIADTLDGKNFYSTHRKYVAPPTGSDVSITLSTGPAYLPDIPLSVTDSIMSLPRPVATSSKTSPQLASKGKCAEEAGTKSMEQQTRVASRLGLSPSDGENANLVQADAHGPVNNATAIDLCNKTIQGPVIGTRLYVRRKANQLVVAPSQGVDSLLTEAQSNQAGKTGLISSLYVKRKINQLVRSGTGKGSSNQNSVQVGLLADGPSRDIIEEQRGGGTLIMKKMRLGRALRQRKGPTGGSSWVWTLSGAPVGHAGAPPVQGLRSGPLLLPWKRQYSRKICVRSQRLRPLLECTKGSLLFLMSKRVRRVQPVQPMYTRSVDGFSLHRSGVVSVGGGNLKWTKSLEKRAKQASKAATKAVAEAERRKREKKEAIVEAVAKVKAERRAARKASRGEGERIVWVGLVRYKMDASSKTLQRIPDSKAIGETDPMAPTSLAKTPPVLTPRRSIIGGTVYLRVGNGNQLVRDPKAASRALASEKVRWSLHNARSRGAKKQQFCQFFTKFGKCNKENGKCPYIHDCDKVAVCTRFLRGTCADGQCLLTHKIIPERMPDCSFFLEGLCTNENCPYRHVNVNPKAPYCDGFLRGYCKDGDKCIKKHRYICSAYAEMGECLNRATCKFQHPKKKEKPFAPAKCQRIGTKCKRRYFSSEAPGSVRRKDDTSYFREDATQDHALEEGSMEFISLSNIESDEEQRVSVQSQSWSRFAGIFRMKGGGLPDDVDKWIKPTFLLQMTSPTAAAH